MARLSSDAVTAIVDGSHSARSIAELQEVFGSVTGVTAEACQQMVAALLAMAQVRRARKEGPAEFAEVLSQDTDLAIPDDDRESFKSNLARLLDAEGFRSLGRAADVATEHEHVLIDSRVLTDLRPVFRREFQQDGVPEPEGMVVVHSLKLVYQQDGIYHQFYVALDGADLESLISALQRASQKADGLRELMRASSITEFALGWET